MTKIEEAKNLAIESVTIWEESKDIQVLISYFHDFLVDKESEKEEAIMRVLSGYD